MEWMFMVFGVGTAVYTFMIIRDHFIDERIQDLQRETLLEERQDIELQIQAHQEAHAEIVSEIQEIRNNMKEYQDLVHKREVEIRQFEEEMAKRGKYRV